MTDTPFESGAHLSFGPWMNPDEIAGVPQLPVTGRSFAASFDDATSGPPKSRQYFEMFGHRGLWKDGWKAVAYHPPETSFDDDEWELYDLETDFSETRNLAAAEPDRLQAMIDEWWEEAEANQVLPLDDRFGQRFAENAARHQPSGQTFTFWAGMGHLPTDCAPDVRARSYTIEAHISATASGRTRIAT